MSKGQAERRLQREFLFVFDSKSVRGQATAHKLKTDRETRVRRSRITNEEEKAARQKLIAELREFGC